MLRKYQYAGSLPALTVQATGLQLPNITGPIYSLHDPTELDLSGLRSQYGVNPNPVKTSGGLKNAAGKIGGWMGNTVGGQLATKGLDMLTGMVNADEDSSYAMEQQIGSMLLKSGNPYAMAAGAVVKANSALNQVFGTNTNTINKKQAKEAGISGFGRTMNNVNGFINNISLPGLNPGTFVGKTHDAYMSRESEELRSAYSDSIGEMETAQTMGGKKYLFGKRKANQFIDEANDRNTLLTSLGLDTKQRISAVPDLSELNQTRNFNKYNGGRPTMTVGKEGLKLPDKEWLQKVKASKLIVENESTIQTFKEGGIIGIEQNVIPEGALHAHKNHLEEVNPEMDAVTEKGIPVIVTDENKNIVQLAEIEDSELILTKELTDKIEALWKDGSDEAMLEAGKLLATELMENTKDNRENGDTEN